LISFLTLPAVVYVQANVVDDLGQDDGGGGGALLTPSLSLATLAI
jgi:hypothetical protein